MPTSVNNIYQSKNVALSPNPVKDIATFKATEGELNQIEILNIQGQIVKSVILNHNVYSMNMQELTAGVYFARIHSTKGVEVVKLQLQ